MSPYRSGVSTHLDLLPAEIKCSILKQTPDMRTLRALLRASRQYFLVYKLSKGTILSHITRNQITPAVLPIAVYALGQRNHRGPRRNYVVVLAFLENFPHGSPRVPYDLPLETSKALLQFHEIVEYFISDFAISRLCIIRNYLHPETPNSLPHESPCGVAETKMCFALSQTEFSRLAKAFYLMELYGGLFYTSASREDDTTVAE